MNIFSGVVVFVLIWWMVFFCALPFGIKPIENPEKGMMPGAPVNPGLKKKILITTIISALLWGIAYMIITSNLISFHDMSLKMAQ